MGKAISSWSSSTPLNHQASAAFASMLMHYKSYHRALHLSEDTIVRSSFRLMTGAGMLQVPVISKRLANLLKMESHPLLIISKNLDDAKVEDFPNVATDFRDGTFVEKFGQYALRILNGNYVPSSMNCVTHD